MAWREFGPLESSRSFAEAQPAPTGGTEQPPVPTGAGNVIGGVAALGSIVGTDLHIPGPGVVGIHMEQDGAATFGGTAVGLGEDRIDIDPTAYGANGGKLKMWGATGQEDAIVLTWQHATGVNGISAIWLAPDAEAAWGVSQPANLGVVNSDVLNQGRINLYCDEIMAADGDETGPGPWITMLQRTAPATPFNNSLRIYVKDKGGTSALYAKDDAGTEHELTNAAAAATSTVFATVQKWSTS